MPGFDRTGPAGTGPMTGRGFGPCWFGFGRRFGFGRGRGLGRYFNWIVPQTKEEKIKAVTQYQEALKEELEDIKRELEELSRE